MQTCDNIPPSVVYLVTHVATGRRCYVGVTRQGLERRRIQHLCCARLRRYSHLAFYRALRKYGAEAFCFSVLETCSSYREALSMECRFIAELRPEYNATNGGEGIIGYRHTAEARAKNRAKKLLNPTRYWLGKRRDQETINKIRATKAQGSKAPPETELMRLTRAANCRKGTLGRQKRVLCVDDGRVFESARAAGDAYGLLPRSVAGVCNQNGRRGTIYGRRFRYLEGAPS